MAIDCCDRKQVFMIPLVFVLSQCSHCSCDAIATDRMQLSDGGSIKAELGVSNSAVTLRITNVSSEEMTLDRDLAFFSSITIFDHDGKKMVPSVFADIHQDVRRVDSYFERHFNEDKVNLSHQLVTLKPGESLCKIYREHEYVQEYRLAVSFEGRTSVSRYAWKMPAIRDIAKLSVTCDADSWNAPVINIIANKTNQKLPKNLFQDAVRIDWEEKAQ